MQFKDVMVVLGCRSGGQPLTPDAASARGSDGGLLPLSSTFAAPASNDGSGLGLGLGGGGVGSAYGGRDGGGDSVLASIQEVPTPMGEGGGGAARAGIPGGAKSAGATPEGKVKKKKKAVVAAGVPGQEPGLGLPVQVRAGRAVLSSGYVWGVWGAVSAVMWWLSKFLSVVLAKGIGMPEGQQLNSDFAAGVQDWRRR